MGLHMDICSTIPSKMAKLETRPIYLAASTAPQFPQGGIYETSNNGKTWKQIFSRDSTRQGRFDSPGGFIHVYSVDVHPTKPSIIYACSGGYGLWCSQDAGKTWKFMDGVPHAKVTHVTVDPDDPETIYVTTFGGGTWKGYYLP